MDIKKMLKIEQARHGLSGAETARRAGMTPQTYSDMLSRGDMKVGTLEHVANAMGCELEITFKDIKKG